MAMTNTQYLLLRLAGEAAEVAQIALKTAEFGLHEVYETRSNLLRCHDELNDLLGVVQKLNAETEFGFVPSQVALDAKCAKIDKYRDYSYHLGMVQSGSCLKPRSEAR